MTTKIHVVVDALGNPLKVSLTKGQVHDITQAEPLTANIVPGAMLADKGYDANSFIQSLEVRGIAVVIPSKSNRKVQRDCDYALYAERNLVKGSSITSNTFEASQHATRKPQEIFSQDFTSSVPWHGSNEDRP